VWRWWPRTIGLPLFRGLVEGIYQELGENWDLCAAEREGMRDGGVLAGQYDRVLRSYDTISRLNSHV
jgi:hypothetical protein